MTTSLLSHNCSSNRMRREEISHEACFWLPSRSLKVTLVNKWWVLSSDFLRWSAGNMTFLYFSFCDNSLRRVTRPCFQPDTSSGKNLSRCLCVWVCDWVWACVCMGGGGTVAYQLRPHEGEKMKTNTGILQLPKVRAILYYVTTINNFFFNTPVHWSIIHKMH